jgi:hypothetical protein
MRKHNSDWNLLQHALAWALDENIQEDTKQRLISKRKTVRFLSLYAQAKQKAGMPTEAFVSMSVGIHIEPTNLALRNCPSCRRLIL